MNDYSFIDLHMHTIHSHEEGCNLSVADLLKQCQEKAKLSGKDCVIAIADHNSIEGVLEAKEILRKDGATKYPNVKIINGIEITTDLDEMRGVFDGVKVFNRCHTLAYNFDENDKELNAYSKITHMYFNNFENVGMQICAARRVVNEHYGIYLNFTDLEELSNKQTDFKNEFIKLVDSYVTNNKLGIELYDIDSLISPYIENTVDFVREASAKGRLLLSEVSSIISNAGGELVIAHPSVIKVTVNGINHLANKHSIASDTIYRNISGRRTGSIDLRFTEKPELVLNEFIDAFEKIANTKIVGIERFCVKNFLSTFQKSVEKICKENKYYQTCGSDYHGSTISVYGEVGNVLPYEVQDNYKAMYDPNCGVLKPLRVSKLSYVEHCLDGDKYSDVVVLKNEKNETMKDDFLNFLYDASVKRNIETDAEITYDTPQQSKHSLNNLCDELEKIQSKLNKIASENGKSNQGKYVLSLNIEIDNILDKICYLKNITKNKDAILKMVEYEKFYNSFNSLRDNVKEYIIKNPDKIKGLYSDMDYYYKRTELAIAQLSNLTIIEPSFITQLENANLEEDLSR